MQANLLTLVVLAVALLGLSTSNAELTAFDCSSASGSKTLDFYFQHHSCDIKEMRTVPGRVVARPGPKTVVGYRCLVTHTENWWSNGVAKPLVLAATIEKVSREDCLRAHKNKIMELDGQRSSHLDLGKTGVLSKLRSDPVGSVTNVYEITLSEHLGSVDFEGDIVSFDVGVDCDFSKFGCEDDQFGQIFWTSDVQSGLNHKDIFIGNISFFTNTVTNVTYAVLDGLNVLAVKVHAIINLDDAHEGTYYKYAFWVEHSDWFIDVADGDAPFTQSLFLSQNSEIVYYEKWGTPKESVIKNWCENESRMPNNYESLFKRLRDLPDKNIGYMENFALQKFKTTCHQTTVSRRETNQCFDEIPVKYVKSEEEIEDMFLRRTSRILVKYAEAISCPVEPSDPVKVFLILLVSFWGLSILVRLVTEVYYLSKAENQEQGAETTKRLITLENVYDVLKPPFMGKYPGKQNGILVSAPSAPTREVIYTAPLKQTSKHPVEDDNVYESIDLS